MKETFTGTSYWEDITDIWDSMTSSSYPPTWDGLTSLTEASSLSRTWTEPSGYSPSYSDVRAAALGKMRAVYVDFLRLADAPSVTYTEL